jgi:hypothetical protein
MIFSFSGKVQDRIINGHREVMDADHSGVAREKMAGIYTNAQELKSVTSMKLEQCHVFLSLPLSAAAVCAVKTRQ